MACGKNLGHGETCCVGHECDQCRAIKGKTNIHAIKVPCGKTTGHGESCVDGRLCGNCVKIRRMRGY